MNKIELLDERERYIETKTSVVHCDYLLDENI